MRDFRFAIAIAAGGFLFGCPGGGHNSGAGDLGAGGTGESMDAGGTSGNDAGGGGARGDIDFGLDVVASGSGGDDAADATSESTGAVDGSTGDTGLDQASSPRTAVKVFMIGGTTSDHLPMTTRGAPIIRQMGVSENLTIDYTTDVSLINDANLAKYQVFLQMNMYPFDLNAQEQASLQKFIEQGKGWFGVHAAGCAQPNWAWFESFLGGVTWVSHANLRSGTLIFEDRTHPATKNMPASIVISDEWYQFSASPRPNVHVLAKADEHTYSPYDPNGDHPMMWTNPTYPKMIYLSIGHDARDWDNPTFVTLVHDALMWTIQ